jgi:hypothetical protein
MKQSGILLLCLVLVCVLACNSWSLPESWITTGAVLLTASPQQGLPGRSTATPDVFAITPVPQTPLVTSPFTFPTSPPDIAPTPGQDCTGVFPIDSIEAIEFGQTGISQLEASFGHPVYQGGRPTRFRFEDKGCILLVTMGIDEAQEAEVLMYGTLDLVLERYGSPAAVGISQGNLTLPLIGSVVLLYPELGIIAMFDVGPDELTRSALVSTLNFRAPFEVEQQVTRLNLSPIEWQPPLR